jgi:hypothetical protein
VSLARRVRGALFLLGAAGLAAATSTGCGSDAAGPDGDREARLAAAAATITTTEIADHVAALAADSMRGRDSPSPELDRAAGYIETAFRSAGLEPGNGASFSQTFPVGASKNGPGGTVRNVIGWIPGIDPRLREEYVVFTAHYDHIGVAGVPDARGDSIYNGADDNASGTAALLEIAEAFGALAAPPRRSVVFLATAAEELGLLGAEHYVANPTFPLDRTVANLNLDMIGRNDPGSVAVIRTSTSTLADSALAAAARHPEIGISPIDVPDDQLVRRSDCFAFLARGVDALFFHSGVHVDYHGLDDEPQRLDAAKAAAVAKLAWWTGVLLTD